MKKLFYELILASDKTPTFSDKLSYIFNVVLTFTPIAYLLNGLNIWFQNNQQFSTFVTICLIANMGVGVWFHIQAKSFSWEFFFKRNFIMWAVLIVAYGMLEMLRLTAGDNIIGDAFKILIQVSTLLYPISKVLKNLFLLSNKQFPPAFIMEKIYTFEKSGNLKDLFNTDNNEPKITE